MENLTKTDIYMFTISKIYTNTFNCVNSFLLTYDITYKIKVSYPFWKYFSVRNISVDDIVHYHIAAVFSKSGRLKQNLAKTYKIQAKKLERSIFNYIKFDLRKNGININEFEITNIKPSYEN